MIPVRIRLRGFLSYKEEQVIDFQGASLWILAGPNGSGKSTIFDAITYALFNAHRGGQKNAEELIHKQANALEVDFEFRVQDKLYRISRTLKKSPGKSHKLRYSGTRQAYEWHSHDWKPIPDTDKEDGFKEWIKNLLGFDYETFTSSVLLLQGQAEKLLQNTPKGRFEVLKHVVDLERYERLYQYADEKSKSIKREWELIRGQCDSIPPVTDEQLQQAEQTLNQAEQKLQACKDQLEQLYRLRTESIRWTELGQQIRDCQRRFTQIQELCRQASTIEQNYHRWCDLRQALPVVETIVTARQHIAESQGHVSEIQRNLEKVQAELAGLQEEHRRLQKERDDHRQRLQQDRSQREALQRRLRELGPLVTLLDQWTQAQETVQKLQKELQSYPSDLEEQYRRLETEVERLSRWKEDYSHLELLHRRQSQLRQTVAQWQQAQEQEQKLLSEGQQARQHLQSLECQRDQVQKVHEEAQKRLTQAQTLEEQARAQVEEFHNLRGAPTCSRCGQPLTREHYADEELRRQNTLTAAQATLHTAQIGAQKARQQYEEAKQACEEAQRHLEHLREQYQQKKLQTRQLADQIQALQSECTEIWQRLSPERQAAFGFPPPTDWTGITYPSREDLIQISEAVKRLPDLKRTAEQLRQQRERVLVLQAQWSQAIQRREELQQKLPPTSDSLSLRQEQQQLQTQETVLQQDIELREKTLKTLETDIQRREDMIHEREKASTQWRGELKAEEEKQQHWQEQIERERRRLSAAWQQAVSNAGLSQWHAWKQELEELERRSVETLYQRLQQAQQQRQELQERIQSLQEREQTFPSEVRRPPEEWEQPIEEAKKEEKLLNQQMTAARLEYETLHRHRKERAALETRLQELELQQNRWKKLSQLLGREGLQLYLLRNAEKQIVSYANCILDRLSDGTLYLQRSQTEDGSNTDQALDLECINRHSGGEAIHIAYLSGSQKFRVAVALALGISQYVSHRHQPIECVIIDEGFGCLDREGRQVMIEELRKLGQCLKCILLVSHQEEFADAFPNGYRFRLVHGTTQVEAV
jgi:DNA repair exonuclease SbcCD ATPase subunit